MSDDTITLWELPDNFPMTWKTWLIENSGKERTFTVMTDEVWVSTPYPDDGPEFVVMDEYREVVCDSVVPAPVPCYYEVTNNGE